MNEICFYKVSGKFSLKVYKIFPSIILYLVDPCNLFRLKNNFSKTSGFLQLQISYEICSEIISWFEKKIPFQSSFKMKLKNFNWRFCFCWRAENMFSRIVSKISFIPVQYLTRFHFTPNFFLFKKVKDESTYRKIVSYEKFWFRFKILILNR